MPIFGRGLIGLGATLWLASMAPSSADEFKSWNQQKQDMTPHGIDLPIPTVKAPDPVLIPTPNNNDLNSDPFHPTIRNDPVANSNSNGPAATTTTQEFSKERYEFLKNNAVNALTGQKIQSAPATQGKSPAPTTMPGTSGFIGSQVTGFSAPNPSDNIFVPSTKSPSKLEVISNSVLKFYASKPAQILLDSTKAAGSAIAPKTPAVSILKGAATTADVISAGQSGGSTAAVDKVIEKGFVWGSGKVGGAIGGPFGAASAAGVAQLSYSTGQAIQPWLDSKLKISDGILAIDKRFGFSGDARALLQSEQAAIGLQNQLNSQRIKPDLKSFGMTPNDINAAKQAPLKSAALPTRSDFADAPGKPRNATAPQPKPEPAAIPSRSNAYNRAPRYQQYRQRGPDCQRLHAMAIQRLMMGDISACYQLQAVCPAYVARCG